MQGDQLLMEWKRAKSICQKVIAISRDANVLNTVQKESLNKEQYRSVYDTVYALCVTKEKEQKRVSMVYKQFKEILKEGLLSMSQQLGRERDLCKLQMVRKIWNAYTDSMKRLVNMFAYLNRPFHIKEGKIQQLEKTAIDIIFGTLFTEVALKEYEVIYFKQLDKIRTTQQIRNADTLKGLVHILYTRHLKLGKQAKKQRTPYTDFHVRFSQNAREFYIRTYKSLKQLSPGQYFRSIHTIFEVEQGIAENCFGMVGQALFARQFSQELLESYKQALLVSPRGLKAILKNRQAQTLKTIIEMYKRLLKNIDGFKEQFHQFVYEDVKEFMIDLRTQILVDKSKLNLCTFMEKLIRKNREFMVMMEDSLGNYLNEFISYYKTGVQRAFAEIKLQVCIQEILAFYVDAKLRSSTLREDQLGQQVRNILHIFTCLHNKDIFLKRYSAKLAKRMISSNDAMTNHETFINNLKLNQGMKYTERLQTLIVQLAASRQNQKLVDQTIASYKNGILKIHVGLKVFGEGTWPTQNTVELPDQYLPEELQIANQAIEVYRKQHASKKKLRISFLQSKIRWMYYFEKESQNQLSECYIDTNCLQGCLLYYIYLQRPKPVHLGFLQNYFDKVSSILLKQNLEAMCNAAEKVLTKSQEEPNSVFYQFNNRMKSRRRLINYEAAAQEEQQKLFQQHQDLTRDREMIIDANISKYMKSRKVVMYDMLESEVLKMIKLFVPVKRDIKASVDRLINKDILRRDQRNINVVKYAE